jgi:uncharacterized protein (TIGR03435 family)
MNAPSIRTLVVSLTAGLFATTAAWSQQLTPDAPGPTFDVTAIKLHKGVITFSRDPFIRGRSVTATASTLRDLLTYAYDVRYEQLAGGPGWIGDDHYDLLAKSEGEGVLTPAQARQMMQALLADRFQLQVHRETQEVSMYALVIAKNGPKLKPTAPDATGGYSVRGTDKGMHMEASRSTMEQLSRQLAGTSGRFVVDKTGLTGLYAFTLDWWPANRTPPPDSDAPSMFDALQEQLGLKLEPTKGPIEKLVIDRAQRPSEN